jgi:hypothetical protein
MPSQSKHTRWPLSLILCGALACSRTSQTSTAGDWSTEVVPRDASALPIGANVTVELDQAIGGGSATGQTFTMHLTQPVVALDRAIVIPSGAIVFGHVAGVDGSPNRATAAILRLEFDSLRYEGHRHPFSALVARVALPSGSTVVSPGLDTSAVPPLGRVVRDSAAPSLPTDRISLGAEAQARLPQGTRMTLRSTRHIAL